MIAVLTAVHFVLMFVSFLASFGTSMDRFDSGRTVTVAERMVTGLHQVLTFPIMPFLKFILLRVPGLWGYIPLGLNSLLWGVLLSFALTRYRRRVRDRVKIGTST